MFTIGIVGNGFVGKATQIFSCKSISLKIYDIKPELCVPIGTSLIDIDVCDLIFICVPTPMNHDGSCYTKIIEDISSKLKSPFKIIRSTVPIGFSESMDCFFMPEFLTELNWKEDFITCKHWIFGKKQINTDHNDEFIRRINHLLITNCNEGSIQNNQTYFLTNSEAELLKLSKNCFLAAKVSIMNEIYDLAQALNIDYNNIKSMLKLDQRMGNTHLDVPGYNDHRGFGGTCFPKDTHSLYSQFQSHQVRSLIFQSVLDRNENIDRPACEWTADKWRTTLPITQPISLVAGGAGFLGSNLCSKLLELGHIVIALDNFSTGFERNLKEFKNNPNFLLKIADVCNKIFLPHVDYIWDLACPASPSKYQVDGYSTLMTSILGTKNLLELAIKHRAKFLFTSTSEIYGDPDVTPQSETYWGHVNPVGPRSCYDEGKRCSETMIYEARKQHPSLKIARLFNTYGPKMDINDGRVITNFIKHILKDQPIPIYGDGTQTRSFCYVDDLIEGLIKLMFSNEVGPMNIGDPYNHFKINDLIEVFKKVTNKKIEVKYCPLPEDDPKQRMPDITLIKTKLGWEPKIKLDEGLDRLYKYFESLKNDVIEKSE